MNKKVKKKLLAPDKLMPEMHHFSISLVVK